MKKRLKKIREQIIYLIWQLAKSELTMRDIGEMFGMTVGNVHRAVKKWDEKELGEFEQVFQALIILTRR